MEQINYQQRICEDKVKIDEFLRKQRVGILALVTGEGEFPYAVPLNYVFYRGKIYFHGMGSGKKNNILKEEQKACFTVYEEFGTVSDPVPAKCDTAYFSVMLFGSVELVTDLKTKTEVLQQLLSKFLPGFFKQPVSEVFVDKYRSSLDKKAVAVYELQPAQITAKGNPVDEEHMFSPIK